MLNLFVSIVFKMIAFILFWFQTAEDAKEGPTENGYRRSVEIMGGYSRNIIIKNRNLLALFCSSLH